MYNSKILRKLARSYHWQTLYQHSRKMGSLKLFCNMYDLTQIQIDFLRWLEIYYILQKDLISGEHKNLSEDVINDDIRTEAYLLARAQDNKKNKGKKKKREVISDSKVPSIMFRKKGSK